VSFPGLLILPGMLFAAVAAAQEVSPVKGGINPVDVSCL
jgi:hypothetical protein